MRAFFIQESRPLFAGGVTAGEAIAEIGDGWGGRWDGDGWESGDGMEDGG